MSKEKFERTKPHECGYAEKNSFGLFVCKNHNAANYRACCACVASCRYAEVPKKD